MNSRCPVCGQTLPKGLDQHDLQHRIQKLASPALAKACASWTSTFAIRLPLSDPRSVSGRPWRNQAHLGQIPQNYTMGLPARALITNGSARRGAGGSSVPGARRGTLQRMLVHRTSRSRRAERV
jgi:hypothetical protein